MSRLELDEELGVRLARTALGHVRREYPFKIDQVLTGPDDLRLPRAIHPIFHGSFDWHSCVHGWWTLLTLRRLFPDADTAQAIAALADDSFTVAHVAGEMANFERPAARTFERPYGWAWLLYLHLEASRHDDRGWADALDPFARHLGQRFADYIGVLTYPIRAGTHFNTAFALILALDWAEQFDTALAGTIAERARHWFGNDRDCPAWEPSGDDFLSPSLCEALLMARTLPEPEFAGWFSAFLPGLDNEQPATLFVPASVSDRSDGKIAHLDGLNLSRAWCWRSLEPLLHEDEAAIVRRTAEAHLHSAMPHVSGDYMGEHWLASFALLALLA